MAESVGGIVASVQMDDSTLDAGLSKLRSAIDSTKVQIGMLTAGLANGSVSATEFASNIVKLEGDLKKLQASEAQLMAAHQGEASAARAAAEAEKALASAAEQAAKAEQDATNAAKAREAALVSTMVPLNALIMSGIKYKETLESIAMAEIAANNSQGTMSKAGTRFAEISGGKSNGGGPKEVAMNMADVAVKSNIARQRLMAFGNTLDDLQYVGEMGLRPIINNIMQISPAIGIALLALDQLRKHGEELENVIKNVGDYWLGSFEKASQGSNSVATGIANIISALKEAKKWLDDFGEGWTALTGGDTKARTEQIKAFTETASTSEQKRAKDVADAIEAYGPRKFLGEAIEKRKELSPDLRNGNKEALEAEQKDIIDLYDKAKKGDPNAADALIQRTQGTGAGRAISAALKPKETDAEKAANKKAEDEFNDRLKAQEDAQTKAIDTATDALQKRFNRLRAAGVNVTQDSITAEIRRTGLPQEQGMVEPVASKLQANFDEMISKRMADKGISREEANKEFLSDEASRDKAEMDKKNKPENDARKKAQKELDELLKDEDERKRLEEGNHDLRYRLANTLNPSVEGKSMGLDEYEASIKSTSGFDKLEKRMYEANEILKKIRDNQAEISIIAAKAR